MKINRQAVFEKYNGHCAYCGEEITLKTMQVDHVWPKRLAHWQKDLDPNREENLNPACRKCNNFKHGFVLNSNDDFQFADFRHNIEMQVARLRRFSQFDRAVRYGLISITNKPVQFYFERIKIAPKAFNSASASPEAA
jgi:hypothetical protein